MIRAYIKQQEAEDRKYDQLTLFGLGSEIRGPLTIAEIESESLVEVSHCVDCPQVPFGYANNAWEAFKATAQEGDEIFYFRSDTASWNALAGRQGFALIRKGTIVRTILTLLS